jgi:hypothetical protein
VPADARLAEEAQEQDVDAAKLSTKEGQYGKNWQSNETVQVPRQEQERSRQAAETYANAANFKKAEESTVTAFLVHQGFDQGLRANLSTSFVVGGAEGGGGFAMPQAPAGGGKGGYGGGGGGGVLYKGPAGESVSLGVISLSPAFVEQGRGYAFRKLDAGAEMTVTAGMTGLGRRLAAAGIFALLVALVWFGRRRRAMKESLAAA